MPQLASRRYRGTFTPPHWHKEVREYLNEHLPGRWVGRAVAADNTFCTWPPRSPDLTVCDLFLWGFSSRTVFTSHHFQRHCQNCESASTPQSGTSYKTCLRGVWREWEYRPDICRVTRGAHIGSKIMCFCSVFVKIWFLQNSPTIYTHPI